MFGIVKYFKGKSMGYIPCTFYEDETKAETIKNALQEAADKKTIHLKYEVVKL